MNGVLFPARSGNLSLSSHIQSKPGARPVAYPMDTGSSFTRYKVVTFMLTDHAPPINAKVKIAWRSISPPHMFHEMVHS